MFNQLQCSSFVSKIHRLVIAALFLFAVSQVVADDLAVSGVKKVTEVEGITEYRLSNGVQVLLFPDNSKPKFTLNVTVMVGSRHEGYGEAGMAHLLEHMLFKGTEKYQDIPQLLKDRGVMNMNGTTSVDRTNYYETLPASDENLKFAIEMESDRLVNSLIRGEDLAAEMTVVRSEFERGENSPAAILRQRMVATAFEWHNYGKSTIGNQSDIMRVPVANLRKFYQKFYQPDNIMIVLAGKFDAAKGLEYLEKNFGSMTNPDRELSKTYTEEPSQDGERIVVLRRVGDVRLIGAVYHVTSAGHPDFAACQILGQILSATPSGPLYQQMVKTELASSAFAGSQAFHDPGLFTVISQLPVDGDVEAAKAKLFSIVEGVDDTIVTDETLARAKTRYEKQRERSFTNSESVAIQLSSWRAYGDWRLYFLHRDRIEKVTKEDVLRVAKKYLIRSNRTMGIFEPTDEPVRADLPARPDLAKVLEGYKGRAKIAEGEELVADLDLIDQRTIKGKLESGIEYALLPKESRGDRVTLAGAILFGDEDNLVGKTTAASFLPRLMTRGTKQLSFQEYRDRMDKLGATVSFSGGAGTLGIRIQAKRDTIVDALRLAKQALREPSLEADKLEIMKRQSLTGLEAAKSDPGTLARFALLRKFAPYSSDNVRYVPTLEESIDLISSVSIEEVKEVHEKYLNGKNGYIAVVGDFEQEAVIQELNDVFSNWETEMNYERISTEAPENVSPEHVVIETPDKKNSHYFSSHAFPMRSTDEDYEPLLIGNYILGGGPLSSRLADRIRKQDGLSYSIRSAFRAGYKDANATFGMSAIANPTNMQQVVDTIDEELKRFVDSGVTNDELERAKESYLKSRQSGRASDASLAQLLLGNLQNDRTTEYQKESDQRIATLQKEQVDDAIRRHFRRDKLVIVTAGDFAGAKDEEKTEVTENAEESAKSAEQEPEAAGVGG